MRNLFANLSESDQERYEDDEEFRRAYGPNIPYYGDCGIDDCLLDIHIDLTFGSYGSCHGVIRHMKESYHSDESIFVSVWTCDGDEREFKMEMSGDQILAYLFLSNQSLERPDWFSNESEFGKYAMPYLSVPEGVYMVDWQLPAEIDDILPSIYNFEEETATEKWMITFWRLNDPAAASRLGGCTKSYPTPVTLTMMLFMKDYDPSTKLPTIITPAKKKVLKLADVYTCKLSGCQYEQLANLEELVESIAKKAAKLQHDSRPKKAAEMQSESIAKKAKLTADASKWHDVYDMVLGLILTLSDKFEGRKDSWVSTSDIERRETISTNVVQLIGSILLDPPSAIEKAAINEDMHGDFGILDHLKSGSFVQIIKSDDFEAEHPEAYETWTLLVGEEERSSDSEDDDEDNDEDDDED